MGANGVRTRLVLLLCLISRNGIIAPRLPRTIESGAPDSTTGHQQSYGYYQPSQGAQQAVGAFPQTLPQQPHTQSQAVYDPNTGKYYVPVAQLPPQQPMVGGPVYQLAPGQEMQTRMHGQHVGYTQQMQSGMPALQAPYGQSFQSNIPAQSMGYGELLQPRVPTQQMAYGQSMQSGYQMQTVGYGQQMQQLQRPRFMVDAPIEISDDEDDIIPVTRPPVQITQRTTHRSTAGQTGLPYTLTSQSFGRAPMQQQAGLPQTVTSQTFQHFQPQHIPHKQASLPHTVTSQTVQQFQPQQQSGMPYTMTSADVGSLQQPSVLSQRTAVPPVSGQQVLLRPDQIKTEFVPPEEEALRAGGTFGMAYTAVFVKLSDLPPQLR